LSSSLLGKCDGGNAPFVSAAQEQEQASACEKVIAALNKETIKIAVLLHDQDAARVEVVGNININRLLNLPPAMTTRQREKKQSVIRTITAIKRRHVLKLKSGMLAVRIRVDIFFQLNVEKWKK
jgi:hypothetical protein